MGISASNLNISTSHLFRNIATPAPNTAEISRGAFRTPSASALAPSNTAYGTNANAALGGPAFISSAAVLEQNAITNSNVVTTQNAIENGSELEQALNIIAQETPGSRFNTGNGIFTTNKVQEQTNVNAKEFSPIKTFSNTRTESSIFENTVSLTGRTATVTSENATKFAAVNANFNVNFSQQGAQALQALQASAALATIQNTNITARMDGMIPMAPTNLTDFSTTTPSNASNLKIFDNITETFNHIMSGGGQGGSSGGLAHPQKEEPPPEQQKKKGINFLG